MSWSQSPKQDLWTTWHKLCPFLMSSLHEAIESGEKSDNKKRCCLGEILDSCIPPPELYFARVFSLNLTFKEKLKTQR